VAARITTEGLGARRATFMVFLFLGHMVLSPIAWVPEYIDRLDISFVQWGVILGFAPLGALSAIVIAPAMINRFGVAQVIRLSAPLAAALLVPLGFTTSPIGWAAIHMVFHFMASLAGVAVNTHAVLLQKKAGQPILTGMHAGWSIGAVAAAMTGGAATLVLPLEVYLVAVAMVTILGVGVASRFFLSRSADGQSEEKAPVARLRVTKIPARLWLLGFGALAAMMPEVAVFEWSAVLARESGADLSIRALPFASFMAGMIVGRLSVARLARRFDVHAIAVTGGFLAVGTMAIGVAGAALLSAFSPFAAVIWLSSCWLVSGFGLAPLGPTMISTGSSIPGISTPHAIGVLSFVAQTTSILAKILMGAVAEGVGISYTFMVPVALLVAGTLIAHRTSAQIRVQDFEKAQAFTGSLPIIDSESRGSEKN